MKANELRIGNWVIMGDLGEDQMNPYNIYQYALCQSGGNVADFYHGFKPIPLTEEWLVRLGFSLQTDNEEEPDNLDKTFYTNNSEMQIETEGGIMILWEGMAFTWSEKILYIHQLQNLYFALTGEELILK